MVRFLPSYRTVFNMQYRGMTPSEAAEEALKEIAKYYPNFSGAIVALNKWGEWGAASYNVDPFPFSYQDMSLSDPILLSVPAI
jgi:N4-(beta-N-acetylglucosaminyl)-L-asparaginase